MRLTKHKTNCIRQVRGKRYKVKGMSQMSLMVNQIRLYKIKPLTSYLLPYAKRYPLGFTSTKPRFMRLVQEVYKARRISTLLLTTGLAILPTVEVLAQPYSDSYVLPQAEYNVNGVGVTLPDWGRISFNNLPPITKGGEIVVPGSVVRQLGYNPSRSWTAGQTADTYMMLGDFGSSFGLQEFSIKNIGDILGLDLSRISLKDYGLVSYQTAGTLVEAIPGLENVPIRKVKPLYDLLRYEGFGFGDNAKIGNLINQYDSLKDIPLGNLGNRLGKYSLKSIPGLAQTKIGRFSRWQQSFLSEVPGLKYVPFGLFPIPIVNGGFNVLGRADIVFSAAEQGDPKAAGYFISGGANGGTARFPRIKPEDCKPGKPCSYLELQDLFGIGNSLHGKRWGSGETQQVEGGFGFLKFVNGGKEPTGLLPYGPVFKVVLIGVDESRGVAEFGLYLRACAETLFFGYHCTSYCIGPIPWFPVREKDAVIILSYLLKLYQENNHLEIAYGWE